MNTIYALLVILSLFALAISLPLCAFRTSRPFAKKLLTVGGVVFVVSLWQYEPATKSGDVKVEDQTGNAAADEKKQREFAEREARANENSRRREADRKKKKEAAAQALAEMPEDLRQEQITKDLARKLARERGDPEPGSCRDKLDCWGEQNQLRATSLCAPLIERHAKYNHEWTDGWLGAKFTHYRWADKKTGIVTHIGDKIKFQNGFGAWSNMVYECDFNPTTSRVLDVRVRPGRL